MEEDELAGGTARGKRLLRKLIPIEAPFTERKREQTQKGKGERYIKRS